MTSVTVTRDLVVLRGCNPCSSHDGEDGDDGDFPVLEFGTTVDRHYKSGLKRWKMGMKVSMHRYN